MPAEELTEANYYPSHSCSKLLVSSSFGLVTECCKH